MIRSCQSRGKIIFFLPRSKIMGAPNIKDTDVAKKARRLAKLKGTSTTAAVSEAFDAGLENAEHKAKLDRDARERRVDEAMRVFVHPFHLTLRPTKKL
jgi:hypothetical protein